MRRNRRSNCSRSLPVKKLAAVGLLCLSMLFASCAGENAAPKQSAAPAPQPGKIISFYPGQAAVAPGDKAQVCYGVENVKSVRFEPAVMEIRPLTTKCVWFTPPESMDLTLIAEGEDGKELRETIAVKVAAGAAPTTKTARQPVPQTGLIETFIATASSVSPGGSTMICYVLREQATMTMDPPSGPLGNDLRKCVQVRPTATTTYTLSASANGKTDSAKVKVTVE